MRIIYISTQFIEKVIKQLRQKCDVVSDVIGKIRNKILIKNFGIFTKLRFLARNKVFGCSQRES